MDLTSTYFRRISELFISSDKLIYAYPVSGKTTAANNIMMSAEVKCFDTDDLIEPLLSRYGVRLHGKDFADAGAMHAVAVSKGRVPVFTNTFEFIGLLRRMGYQVLSVNISDSDFKRNLVERMNKDWNVIAESQYVKWRSDAQSNLYLFSDVILPSFDAITEVVLKPFSLPHCASLSITDDQLRMLSRSEYDEPSWFQREVAYSVSGEYFTFDIGDRGEGAIRNRWGVTGIGLNLEEPRIIVEKSETMNDLMRYSAVFRKVGYQRIEGHLRDMRIFKANDITLDFDWFRKGEGHKPQVLKFVSDGDSILDFGGGESSVFTGKLKVSVDLIDPRARNGVRLDDVEKAKRMYDVVHCSQSLHHLKDVNGTLARLVKLVKPGGVLIIAEHDVADIRTANVVASYHVKLYNDKGPLNFFSLKDLTSTLIDEGFIRVGLYSKSTPDDPEYTSYVVPVPENDVKLKNSNLYIQRNRHCCDEGEGSFRYERAAMSDIYIHNIFNPQPDLSYNDLQFGVYKDEGKGIHDGQAKLFLSTLYFLTRFSEPKDVVHYAGAAPGHNITKLAKMFPMLTFKLYDPLPIYATGHNVEIFNTKYVPSKCDLLISDVRVDAEGEEKEVNVLADLQLQKEWVYTTKCRHALLKFRLPYLEDIDHINYFNGEVILQPYSRPTSAEVRLAVNPKDGMRRWDVEVHSAKMAYFNANRPEFDRRLESSYLDAYIKSSFYFSIIGLFSVSNISNPHPIEVLKQIGSTKCASAVFNFPIYQLAQVWRPGLNNIWFWKHICLFTLHFSTQTCFFRWSDQGFRQTLPRDKDIDVIVYVKGKSCWLFNDLVFPDGRSVRHKGHNTWVRNEDFSKSDMTVNGIKVLTHFIVNKPPSGHVYLDWCLNPTYLPVNWEYHTAVDLFTVKHCQQNGWHQISNLRFIDPGSPVLNLWGMVTHGIAALRDNFQTWRNSQTLLVKVMSSRIRQFFKQSQNEFNLSRWIACMVMYGGDVDFVEFGTITAYNRKSGRYINVSGHAVNVLIATSFGLVDFKRWLNATMNHILLYLHKSGVRLKDGDHLIPLSILREQEYLTEEKDIKLWHNYDDYQVSICAFLIIANKLQLRVDARCIIEFARALSDMARKYPAFITRESYLSKKFRDRGGLQGSKRNWRNYL